MPARRRPTVRLRKLGTELHRLRESAGMTLQEASELLERSVASISNIENGQVRIPVRDLRVILDAYGVTEERKREGLLALARDGNKKGWWQSYSDVLSDVYADLISLEAEVASVRTFEMGLVPGLLQTEDYTRAVFQANRLTAGSQDIERLVGVRMARQRVLTREESPLRLWAVVGEAALRQRLGGPKVLRAQLHRLVEVAELDNVTVQVLPFTAEVHPSVEGAFTILTFPEPTDLDVVHLESLTSSLYVEHEADVGRYSLAFEHLQAAALDTVDSRRLIRDMANEL